MITGGNYDIVNLPQKEYVKILQLYTSETLEVPLMGLRKRSSNNTWGNISCENLM